MLRRGHMRSFLLCLVLYVFWFPLVSGLDVLGSER